MCPSCGENEAVFFQSQQRSAETGMVRDAISFSFCRLSIADRSSERNSTMFAALAVTSSHDPFLHHDLHYDLPQSIHDTQSLSTL